MITSASPLVSVISGPSRGAFAPVTPTGLLVGADPDCHLVLTGVGVSGKHLRLMQGPSGVSFSVLPDAQDVLLAGTRCREGVLHTGETLHVGDSQLTVEDIANQDSTRATPRTPSGEVIAPTLAKPEGAGVLFAGKYRLLQRLAAGGMGEVHRAEHIELQKQVAIKLMRAELGNDKAFVARFRREAVAASRIGHPNIIDVSDFGQADDGRFYCVMEFIDGLTLTQLLREKGPLPWRRAVVLLNPIANALLAAHAVGVVHRDLKPDNVMVATLPGRGEVVKVLDFGIAKVTHNLTDSLATNSGAVIGTPQYMSPEQASGLGVDPKTDVYALGLLAYELLTGKPTFVAPTAALVMTKQIHDAAPKVEVPGVPHALTSLIARMLEKDPQQRPTMQECVTVFVEIAAHGVDAPPRKSVRSLVMMVVPGLLVGAVGAGAFLLLRGPDQPPVVTAPVPPTPTPTPTTPPPKPVVVEPPPAPAQVSREVQTTPPGAEVWLDGGLVGVTPWTSERPLGAVQTLELRRAGFVAQTLQQHFTDAGVDSVQLKAVPAAPKAQPKVAPKPKLKRLED